MSCSIFMTGTDTNVGKTYITAGLVRALRKVGIDAVGFKPFESGGRSDGQVLLDASGGGLELDDINPVWYPQPLAPLVAAGSAGVTPQDLDRVRVAHDKLKQNHDLILVEGAGGFLVPLSKQITTADLASELCSEVVVVAPNRLGVINHTLLTCEAAATRKIKCPLIVLNDMPDHPDENRLGFNQSGTVYDLSKQRNFTTLSDCFEGRVEVFHFTNDHCFPRLAEIVGR